jgi:hypothetical protein
MRIILAQVAAKAEPAGSSTRPEGLVGVGARGDDWLESVIPTLIEPEWSALDAEVTVKGTKYYKDDELNTSCLRGCRDREDG